MTEQEKKIRELTEKVESQKVVIAKMADDLGKITLRGNADEMLSDLETLLGEVGAEIPFPGWRGALQAVRTLAHKKRAAEEKIRVVKEQTLSAFRIAGV